MRVVVPLGLAVAAGVAGAVLRLVDVRTPATGWLTLVFVLLTPAVCVALLLPGLDPPARWIVSGTAALVLAGSIAEVMLVTSGWSPAGGTVATAAVCTALAAGAGALRLRARLGRLGRRRRTEPASVAEPTGPEA